MVILSQLDQRWSKIKMLPSNITIGKAGCTTTAICMLSDYFKCFRTPDQVVNVNIFYNKDGEIIWSLTKFDKFKFEWRSYGRDNQKINESLKLKEKACILQIHDSHWVVAIRRIGPLIWVYDPWGGTKHFINQSIVTGAAHFIEK